MTAVPIYSSDYADRSFSVPDDNAALPRHRWYQFKEGFSEGLIKEAFKDLGGAGELLDPFVGSGTSVVSAGRLGRHATGIEVNPFLAFTARAKCTPGPWHESACDKAVAELTARTYVARSPLEGNSTFTYRRGLERWLFNRGVLRAFHGIDCRLRLYPRYQKPLRLALMAALMDCCNAKRDGKCLRYKSNWRSDKASGSDLVDAFRRRAKEIAQDVNAPFEPNGLRVLRGDAREVLRRLPANHFSAMVTSPPYLNSFDYSDVYRPELYAGGFVSTTEELRRIRFKTVRSHVQVDWPKPTKIVSPLIPPVLERMKSSADTLWDQRLPAMVQAYFEDMAGILFECSRVCKKGARAWIVVSTSAYSGAEVPVDLILADIATNNAWNLVGVYVLRSLRAAGQQWQDLGSGVKPPLRESLVMLQKA
jgi:DNA modification methylase